WLAVHQQEHGGHRPDLECRGQLLLLVHVDLGQLERAVVFAGELFQDRAQGLAGAAPFGPEVDQHGRRGRLLEDVGLEIGGGGVEDVGWGLAAHWWEIPVQMPQAWCRSRRNPSRTALYTGVAARTVFGGSSWMQV